MEHGLNVHPLLVRYLCWIQTKHQYYLSNEAIKLLNMSVICFVFLDMGYTNNGEQCRNRCKFYGPMYEEKNMCRTLAGDLDYCTPTGEFISNILYHK